MPDYQGTCDWTEALQQIKDELDEIKNMISAPVDNSYDDQWIRDKHEDLDVKMASFAVDLSFIDTWQEAVVAFLVGLGGAVGVAGFVYEVGGELTKERMIELTTTIGRGIQVPMRDIVSTGRKALDLGNAAKTIAETAKNLSGEALRKVVELGTLVNSPIKGLPFLKGKIGIIAAIVLAIAAALGLAYKAKIEADVREVSVNEDVLDDVVENRMMNAVATLQNQFNSFMSSHLTIHGQIDRAQEKQDELIASLQQSATNRNNDANEAKSRLGKLELSANGRNADALDAKQRLSKLEGNQSSVEERLAGRNADAWQAKQDINFLRSEIQSLNSRAEARNTDAWQAKQDIKTLQAAIEVLESKASSRNEDAYAAKQDIKALESAIGVLESKASSRNEDAYKAKQDISRLQAEIESLRNSKSEVKETDLSGIRSEITSLRSELERLRASIPTATDTSQLQAEIENLERINSQFRTNASESLNTLNDSLTRVQARVDELVLNPPKGEKGATGERGLTGAKGEKGDAANTAALESAIAALRERITGISSSVDGLRTGLGRTDTSLDNAWDKIREHSGLIAGITATLGTALIAIEALKNRTMACSWTRTEINSVQTSLANQNRILLALQSIANATLIPATLAIKGVVTSISQVLSTNVVPSLGVLSVATEAIKTSVKNGFKWLSTDRVLNIVNTITTLHNATFLSRDIFESLAGTADTVLSIMGKELKDSEGDTLEVGEFISGKIRGALRSLLGSENYATLVTHWTRLSTIYTAGANVLGNLRSIQDSIISGVEVAASNSAKIGNALMKYGLIGESAFNWLSESPNFEHPSIAALEELSDKADALDTIVSETKSIQDESKDLADNEKALRDRLAGTNPEDGTSWSFDDGLEAKREESTRDATRFADIKLSDIPDD